MALDYYPLSNLPAHLDVVWCYFPENENMRRPGPKPRPALVRAVLLDMKHERALVEVAYGTSKKTPATNPFDLHISNLREMNLMGLPQATCFVLDRTVRVPWARQYFCQRDDGTGPVIGSLTSEGRAQLEALKVQRRFRGR